MSERISKEEANYKAQTNDNKHCSVCSMFETPDKCSLVIGKIAPGGWCKFFEKKKTFGKTGEMSGFNFFIPIEKFDKEKRLVSGYASTPTKDSDGEIVTLDAIKEALPGYMEWRNIREMHKLDAVGTAEEAHVDTKGLYLTAKIVDESAWQKCVEGVYKGFSIGGRKIDKKGNKITAIELMEISVVDRPANPDARFSIAKSAKELSTEAGHLVKIKGEQTKEQKAIKKMAKVVETLVKAGPPAAHDGFSLPAKPNGGELGPNDSRPNENVTRKTDDDAAPCEKHGKIGCEKCSMEKEDKKPYGDVEYADPGYQADKKKRYPIDTEEHIRAAWNYINKPKNSAKYGENASKVKSKIIAAWKSKIDKEGPPSAKEKTIRVEDLSKALSISSEGFLILRKAEKPLKSEKPLKLEKGMNSAGSLAYCFDSIRGVQRSLLSEAKREGGDMKDKGLAKQLGDVAKTLAEIIAQKASHEGAEATTMTDADDSYLSSMLGEDFKMAAKLAKVTGGDDASQENFEENSEMISTGDPIADAVAQLVKRAAEPSKAARMKAAQDNIDKSRKASKAARKAVEEAHEMHKAAYLAKLAKAAKKKKPDDDDDDDDGFDHQGAMEKLQKAYGEIEKARTFGKAAATQMAKAASGVGRSGQRGQEAGDAMAGFYEVPEGVKDLTPNAMAGAGPGTSGSGGMPPAYPTDGGVYPGKAAGGSLRKYVGRDGKISADVAELIMKNAQAEGELEALRRIPSSAVRGGQRPYAFNPSQVMGGTPQGQSLNKTLFDGVDPTDLMSGDEQRHTSASAKVIGNFLTSGQFGKSMMDPSFKGRAAS